MALCPGHARNVCLDFWGLAWVGGTTHINVCETVTAVRMSCPLAVVALKPGLWRLPSSVALLGGCRAREEVMKQHRLLFIFFHSWCAVVAKGWSVVDVGASHPRRLLF